MVSTRSKVVHVAPVPHSIPARTLHLLRPPQRDALTSMLRAGFLYIRQTGYRRVAEKDYALSRDFEVSNAECCWHGLNFAKWRLAKLIETHAGRPYVSTVIVPMGFWSEQACRVRDALLECNRGLILRMVTIEKSRNPITFDYDECESEALLALLAAVEHFDCARGFRFATYACRAISTRFSQRRRQMNSKRRREGAPTDPARRDEGAPCARCALIDDRDELATLLRAGNILTPRQSVAFKLRYGLDGESAHTLDAMAKRLKISVEASRQLLDRGMARLERHAVADATRE